MKLCYYLYFILSFVTCLNASHFSTSIVDNPPTTTWLLSSIGIHFQSTSGVVCKHRKYGTLLYKKDGDLLKALSKALGNATGIVREAAAQLGLSAEKSDKNTDSEDDLEKACLALNKKVHSQANLMIQTYNDDPLLCAEFDPNAVLSKLDPHLVKCMQRRAPKRIDEATSTTHFDATPEDMYHRYYFEILDTLTGEIECRFESSSFTFYAKVESILEGAAVGKDIPTEDVKEIIQHFKEDLVESDLLTELKMLKNVYCEKSFTYKEFKEKMALCRSIFPQTCRLLQLLLVMPATSATAERSFSSLRHVKTYLRTTMKQ